MQALAEPLMDSSNTSKKQRGWSCPRFQGRVKGYVVALGAVLAVSPDGMLLRFIRANQPECVEEDDALVSCNIKMLIVLICIKWPDGHDQARFCHLGVGWATQALRLRPSHGGRWLHPHSSCSSRNSVSQSATRDNHANAIMFFVESSGGAHGLCVASRQGRKAHGHRACGLGTAVFGAFLPTALGLKATQASTPRSLACTLHGNAIALATGVSLAAFITSSRAGSLAEHAPMNVAPALDSLGAAALALRCAAGDGRAAACDASPRLPTHRRRPRGRV